LGKTVWRYGPSISRAASNLALETSLPIVMAGGISCREESRPESLRMERDREYPPRSTLSTGSSQAGAYAARSKKARVAGGGFLERAGSEPKSVSNLPAIPR
jgi:hypothetical protein